MKSAVLLALAAMAALSPGVARTADVAAPAAGAGDQVQQLDRSSFFIGDAITKLRGLNPTFSGRTLTLVDGRGSVDRVPATFIKTMSLPAAWTDAPLSERGYLCSPGSPCSASDLLINHADGSTQLVATGMVGDFIALPGAHRIFSCGDGMVDDQKSGPVIVDLNGNKTALPAHPGPLRVCARTGTGDEVLLVYALTEVGRRYTMARVFDSRGALLTERTFEEEGTLEFNVASRPYSETVPGP